MDIENQNAIKYSKNENGIFKSEEIINNTFEIDVLSLNVDLKISFENI